MEQEPVRAKQQVAPGVGGTILLVDDEESVLTVVSRLLEHAGFTVRSAGGGREAINLFQASSDEIRVVVLDLTMPGMDGEAVYRELAKIKPGIAVILASGFAEDDVVARFAPGEIVGFIQKPYQNDILVGMLREALA